MNDVNGYITIFPATLSVFFALNQPNYASWGTLFLHKLKSAGQELRDILENGACSIWRTKKNYNRLAVDLSLEQTVNRDAASVMKGIVSFQSSENAICHWSLNMNQRAVAVTGLEVGENVTTQCCPSRIERDNRQMAELSARLDKYCNLFTEDAPTFLVNIATGQAASKPTETYPLNTLKRGENKRDKFQDKWNHTRFLQPVKRTQVQNFAAQNAKKLFRKKKYKIHCN